MLKEVLKISALEYQKGSGQIDLSHLKRKNKKPQKSVEESQDFTEAELARLARLAAPKNLAPVEVGPKKPSVSQFPAKSGGM